MSEGVFARGKLNRGKEREMKDLARTAVPCDEFGLTHTHLLAERGIYFTLSIDRHDSAIVASLLYAKVEGSSEDGYLSER